LNGLHILAAIPVQNILDAGPIHSLFLHAGCRVMEDMVPDLLIKKG
jgi:hypothetical protein